MRFFTRANHADALHVLIVRPSKYDDDGYVIRYLRGVLPSNTIAVLSALTKQVFDSGRLGPLKTAEIVSLDDTVQDINVRKLARKYLRPGHRAVVALAGVQSNQFPRATDLAVRFREAGFQVMIGGFHVSGSIATSGAMPAECQALLDVGVTLVKGEVENVWGGLLEDVWKGALKPFYDITEKPDISEAPVPLINPRYQKKFVYPYMGTIDTSRGCPYSCSFCTVINVQGRKMRCRSPETIARHVEESYRRHKIDFHFFTDDNFARNRHWEAILDRLIALREEKKIPVDFMMQVDVQAWRIPRFVDKAARAGCTQVFLGVESLNEKNLEAADKNQNCVDEMGEMVDAWHKVGCACHAGYIVGFPFDTPESVRGDVEKLKALGFDQCSFFMLTPLPGSADHVHLKASGEYMDPDLNNYDSCHETLHLPHFKPGEWFRTYVKAWESFCNFQTIRKVLSRANPHTYWGILKNYMWYKSAFLEGIHPMYSGLWRVKPRVDRRPGSPVEGRFRHFVRRVRDTGAMLRNSFHLLLELQELWLQTRIRPGQERGEIAPVPDGTESPSRAAMLGTRVGEIRDAIMERGANARDWMQDNVSGLITRFNTCVAERVKWRGQGWLFAVPVEKLLVKWNSIGKARLMTSREALNLYWARLVGWVRERRVFRLLLETPRICVYLLREARLWATFLVYFRHEVTGS